MVDSKLIVFASFFPKAGREAELETLLRGMTGPTRAEPGCEIYDLYRTSEGGTSFHLFERYRDRAAFDAHRGTEHYQNYRAQVNDLLAEPIGVLLLEGADVA